MEQKPKFTIKYQYAAKAMGISVDELRKGIHEGMYPFTVPLTGAAYDRYAILRLSFEKYIGRTLTDEEAGAPRKVMPQPVTHSRFGDTYADVSGGGKRVSLKQMLKYPMYTEFDMCSKTRSGKWCAYRYRLVERGVKTGMVAVDYDAPVQSYTMIPLPTRNLKYELVPGQDMNEVRRRYEADAGKREISRGYHTNCKQRRTEEKARRLAYGRAAAELAERRKAEQEEKNNAEQNDSANNDKP